MTDQDLPDEDSIEDEAAIWCLRALGQSSAPFDEAAFQAWIEQSDLHRETFDSMARTWAGLEGMDLSRPAPERAHREAESDAGNERTVFSRRNIVAVAASAVALTVGGIAYRSAGGRRYSTDIGKRSVVRLEDGSSISLDGATRVRVREDGASRQVWLEQGRGSFDVMHDPLRPFSVQVQDKIVVAVGTAFSVELLQDQVRADLHSGVVEVIDDHKTAKAQRHLLARPGDRFIALNDGSAPILTHNNPGKGLAWTKGILDFDDETLSVAAEQMNRYSALQISLSPDLAQQKVSGIFKAGETSKFVAAACQLLNLRAERQGSTIRLAALNT